MSANVLAIAFFLGGAALAPWLDARVPRLAPRGLRQSFLHVLGAFCALNLLPPLFSAVAGGGAPASVFVALFGVFLPLACYVCLSMLWMLKQVAGGAPSLR